MKLVCIRHGESVWNKENLFTGWSDVELSEKGVQEAKEAGQLLKKENYDFDICYTSYLKRAIHTLNYVLDEMDRDWLPVHKSWKLNERHYGALQGLNKAETAKKYGDDQVLIWRRSFDIKPPLLEVSDKRNPKLLEEYRNVDSKELPLAESLKDTIDRVIPYYKEVIVPAIQNQQSVLIVAHGNSLRALMKYLENISDEKIVGINIPTGIPYVYEFDDDMKLINSYYLGDQDLIQAKMNSVANQAKTK